MRLEKLDDYSHPDRRRVGSGCGRMFPCADSVIQPVTYGDGRCKRAGWYDGKTSSCNIETLIMERSTRLSRSVASTHAPTVPITGGDRLDDDVILTNALGTHHMTYGRR